MARPMRRRPVDHVPSESRLPWSDGLINLDWICNSDRRSLQQGHPPISDHRMRATVLGSVSRRAEIQCERLAGLAFMDASECQTSLPVVITLATLEHEASTAVRSHRWPRWIFG